MRTGYPSEHREISSHGEQDRHVPGFVRGVAGADDDIDVPVEQGDEPEEPLGGEAPQLVIPKLGDVRLWNAEPLHGAGSRINAGLRAPRSSSWVRES
jgi:hypothetical protein